jgi:hypothetical protein
MHPLYMNKPIILLYFALLPCFNYLYNHIHQRINNIKFNSMVDSFITRFMQVFVFINPITKLLLLFSIFKLI